MTLAAIFLATNVISNQEVRLVMQDVHYQPYYYSRKLKDFVFAATLNPNP